MTNVKYPALLKVATDVFMAPIGVSMTDHRNLVYDALEAERERCGRLADPIDYPGLAEASDLEKHAYDLRRMIASAIRAIPEKKNG